MVGNFFFSIFASLVIYILLPYLSTFIPTALTGLVVAGGGLLATILFPFLPTLVVRYGAQTLAIGFAILQMIVLVALAAAPGFITNALLIVMLIALQPFLAYQLDILLEACSNDASMMGRIRNLFLTAWGVGILVAPLIVGALLARSDNYNFIFLAAAVLVIPFIVVFVARRLPREVPPKLNNLKDTLSCLLSDKDLAAVTLGHMLLWLFFVWAPLYVPPYLHGVLGISWSNLGWMFSLMLLPYVFLAYPAGWIADKFLGDKELMFAGFIIAGGSLASLSLFTSSTPLAIIVVVLLFSRIGVALVESMTEGHFFRRVSNNDINSMSVFRAAWPIAYFVAPVIGSIILYFSDYQTFFLITGGCIALLGATITLRIKDFR